MEGVSGQPLPVGDKDLRRFWVAHARGCDYDLLQFRGFVVLYPKVDDYVFLEVDPKNDKLRGKQLELGISFLKDKRGQLKSISAEELKAMSAETSEKLVVGATVQVVAGYCANMTGRIVTVDEVAGTAECELDGYRRKYAVKLDLLDLEAVPVEPPAPTGV